MAKPLKPSQRVNLEEVVINNSYEIAAIIKVLEKKGLITREEIREEVKQLKETLHGMIVTVK